MAESGSRADPVLVVTPNIALIMRASMVEVLESEYIEMARLRGCRSARSCCATRSQRAGAGVSSDRAEPGVPRRRDHRRRVGVLLLRVGVRFVSGADRDFPTTQVITMIIAAVYV